MMESHTIPNAGSIFSSNQLEDGPGIRNTGKLLTAVTENFAKISRQYFDVTEEFPFIYNEKQLHSVLFPAIYEVTDAVFLEQPVTRKIKKNKKYGWLDYWVLLGSTIFLIELKHAWHFITSKKVNIDIQNKSKAAIQQIDALKSPEEVSFGNNSIVKIALIVLPYLQTSKYKHKLIAFSKAKIEEKHNGLVSQLNKQPNWSCVWTLHKNLQKPIWYEYGKYELYPAVSFLAYVDNSLAEENN